MLTSCAPLIYVVDDDEDDRKLLQTLFAANFEHCIVQTFEGGSRLLAQLTHRLDGRLPDLIILDLDMPIFSGFELLRYLKQDAAFRSIPVVILSGSQHTEDMDRCHDLGSTAYLAKTPCYSQLVASIRHLRRHWSRTGSMPIASKPRLDIEGLGFTNLSLN